MTVSAATSKGSKSEKLRANWLVVYFEDKCCHTSRSNPASSEGEIHRLFIKSKSNECANSLD